MFLVIDSGTTNSRAYLVQDHGGVLDSRSKKVGVRDTSITGSRDTLRNGLVSLVTELLSANDLVPAQIRFAIASGMITSEIGLIELPHLAAPVGITELREHVFRCTDPDVLPIGCPVYFIRGVKNMDTSSSTIHDLPAIDFMRGEEVQCVGIRRAFQVSGACTIVVLSSHTKFIACDAEGRILASKTSLSGQLYEALCSATNIGTSLKPRAEECSGGYCWEELVNTAYDCVEQDGLTRVLLMPRFMQVLLRTDSSERQVFTDAAIAADDLRMFASLQEQGLLSGPVFLFGHAERCRMYTYLLQTRLCLDAEIQSISDPAQLAQMTVAGVAAIAEEFIRNEEETGCSE